MNGFAAPLRAKCRLMLAFQTLFSVCKMTRKFHTVVFPSSKPTIAAQLPKLDSDGVQHPNKMAFSTKMLARSCAPTPPINWCQSLSVKNASNRP